MMYVTIILVSIVIGITILCYKDLDNSLNQNVANINNLKIKYVSSIVNEAKEKVDLADKTKGEDKYEYMLDYSETKALINQLYNICNNIENKYKMYL